MKKYQLVALNYQDSSLSKELSQKVASLSSWMLSNQIKEISLAAIKKQFPKWLTLATDTDILVSQGILERYDRRYRFNILQVDENMWGDIEKIVTATCQRLSTELLHDSVTKLACLIEYSKLSQQVYLLVEGSLKSHTFFNFLKTEHFIFLDSPVNLGYASYFKKEKQISVTSLSQTITKLLGDVNPDYFCEMVGKVAGTIKEGANQHMIRRPNIFMESLELLGYTVISDNQKVIFDAHYIDLSQQDLEQEISRFKTKFIEALEECHSQLSYLDSMTLELLMYSYLIDSLEKNKYLFAIKN